MPSRSHRFRPGDYALLWFFAAAAAVGVVGSSSLAWRALHVAPVVVAPTVDEYRAAAVQAMAPFLARAESMSNSDLAADGAASFLVTVQSVQDRLLALRVPGSEREAHLAFVLMLERWKRALNGEPGASDLALTQLHQALDTYPWVAAAPQRL